MKYSIQISDGRVLYSPLLLGANPWETNDPAEAAEMWKALIQKVNPFKKEESYRLLENDRVIARYSVNPDSQIKVEVRIAKPLY